MKKILLSVALVSSFSFSAHAQTAAAPASSAPAKAATVTAVCKDGTPFSGATLKGACRGHGGVDKKAGSASASASASAAPPSAPAPAPSAPATPAAKPAAAAKAAAPGGGTGQVWVNTSTKVYHCPGNRYYGKTKTGEYMSEADAQAKGFKGDHGKACTK